MTLAALPEAHEAERAVLGAILLDNAAYDHAVQVVQTADFGLDAHRRLWNRISELSERNVPVDPITLHDALRNTGELDAIGGVAYISGLTEGLPRSVNVAHYAGIVREKSKRRQIFRLVDGIGRRVLEPGESADALLDELQECGAEIVVGSQRSDGLLTLKDVYAMTYKSVDELADTSRGLMTGFAAFDRITSGLQPADLVLIAGRPSMGKTALALSVAANVARRGETVAFFSLEMSRKAVLDRLISAEARLNSHDIRNGRLTSEQRRTLAQAAARATALPIQVCDTSSLRLQQLAAMVRRAKRAKGGLALAIVDYIGLMEAPGEGRLNREQQIAQLSRGLKLIAKELGIPLMVLAQLSRAPEHRGGRPQLSDLRDSGTQEQDADVVGFLYRPEYYARMRGEEVTADIAGRAELIVAKQRNGAVGSAWLCFLDRFARFENLAEV